MNTIFDKNRLNIFIGAYGSGKSEISVNCAVTLKKASPERKVLLADLDIVNPFYRSADAANRLGNSGIRVISPSYANSNVDVPALSGEMYAIFDDDSYCGVFDIGGEDLGANVLGSIHSRLLGIDYSLYMVVNTLRPFTSDATSILQMADELQKAAKANITGFINNTNLLNETTVEDILHGRDIIREASEKSGIPFCATAIMNNLFEKDKDGCLNASKDTELLVLNQTISYDY